MAEVGAIVQPTGKKQFFLKEKDYQSKLYVHMNGTPVSTLFSKTLLQVTFHCVPTVSSATLELM